MSAPDPVMSTTGDPVPPLPAELAPHWAESPSFRFLAYVVGQACNGILLFAKLDPEKWPHVICCVVIFVLPTIGIAVKKGR